MDPETLFWGALAGGGRLPLALAVVWCELRPRFLPKGRAGRGYRAVARNGRVLLASDLPLEELAGHPAHMRLQVWHKAVLPGDLPTPYGLLVCSRSQSRLDAGPVFHTQLVPGSRGAAESPSSLTIDVGGGMVLEFQEAPASGYGSQ